VTATLERVRDWLGQHGFVLCSTPWHSPDGLAGAGA
jgi:hypothetical protein